MNNLITCLLCTVSSAAEVISTTLRDDSSGSFKVVRCLTCGHVQLFPLPAPDEDAAFYEAYCQTRNLMKDVDFSLWQRKVAVDTVRRVGWIRSILPDGGEVLDIGCGYGFLVDALSKTGYQASGIDVIKERLALARTHLNGTFINGEIDSEFVNIHRKRYHVVTLFHVLEHIRDPITFLQQCFQLVMPGGRLLIEVPNMNDELLAQQVDYRAFYWQRAHLSYYDSARLELLLRRAELSDFSIRGVQRYDLRNLLHWLDERKPQLNAPESFATSPLLQRVEGLYKSDRESAMTCDTLIAEVRK